MAKKVLIVDDDRILLNLAENKLKKYAGIFTVLSAADGRQAVDALKENSISLVVTDLQMPKMDGFTLLAHLSENYPDIPVIILTAYSSPASRKSVIEGGAAEYIEKPFVLDELADKIIASLARESEGGILQTVPLELFLQLVEMEQKTCTIRVTNKSSGQKGVLFFKDGILYDARLGNGKGLQSAYQIFSWNKVALSIQDACSVKTRQIGDSLQAILMEAMRLKDETAVSGPALPISPPAESHELSPAASIRDKLAKLNDEKKWLKEVFYDDSWDNLISQAEAFAKQLKSGAMKCCYFNRGEPTDYIVLPGIKSIIISVNPRIPRDRIMRALSE